MKKNLFSNLFIILSFAVITAFCIMLINQFTINEKSDRIFNNFYGNKSLHMSVESVEEELSFDCTGFAGNYVIYKPFNSLSYKTYEMDNVRAVYGEGDFPVPDMIDGSFFTREQMLSDKPVCVLGLEAEKRTAIEIDGKSYYPFRGVNYEIIGHLGSGKTSDLEVTVMLNWGGYFANHGAYTGDYVFDSNHEDDIRKAYDEMESRIHTQIEAGKEIQTFNILYEPVIRSIDTVTQICYDLAIIVLVLNIMLTAFYYAKRKERSIAVKKLTGYSQFLLIFEVIKEYLFYSAIGFAVGASGLKLADKAKLFISSELSYFTDISIPAVALSFALVAALSLTVVTVPVVRIFKTDTSMLLK